MQDLLSAIYHNELFVDRILCDLDKPQTLEERRITAQLRAIDSAAAQELQGSICALSSRQAEEAFCSGIRLGAQLMIQLIEEQT